MAPAGTHLAPRQAMAYGMPKVPPLSYVLVAETADQVFAVSQWLRDHPLSDEVEVVIAAPASVYARLPARLLPSGARPASAINPRNRNDIRSAGAAETTGLVVMVIDCSEEFESHLRDPFAPNSSATPPADLRQLAAELDLPSAVEVHTRR